MGGLEGLQRLKGRTALIVECNDFAVNNRVLNIKGGNRTGRLPQEHGSGRNGESIIWIYRVLETGQPHPSFRLQ